MNSLLIFGASKGTGAYIVNYALQHGYRCITVVRNQSDVDRLRQLGALPLLGDANDATIVDKACQLAGPDSTIISTLGGVNANYQPQMTIINHAEKHQIKQMVLVTSLGCGDSWSTLSERAKAAFGYAVREKTLAESWLQTSHLNYCILRPGGLIDGDPTNNARCYANQEVHGYVMRSDLALIILDKIKHALLDNRVHSVVDPDLNYERPKR